jgi:phenylacetate-CoA ligase
MDAQTATDAAARQRAKLRALIDRCEQNPFYGPRLREAGLSGVTSVDVADLQHLEPVDKGDILSDQEAHPPYGSRLGVSAGQLREVHLTSGTSGLGQEMMGLTDDDVAVSAATWGPVLRSAGLGHGDLFATFYPATLFAYGRSVLSASRAFGVPVVSMSGVDRDVALSLMRRLSPRAIGARPALFALLAEQLGREGSSPRAAFPDVRSLVVSGVTAPQAVNLQTEWGATVHEVYGMSQAAGIIAATGPEGAAPGGEAGIMLCNADLFLVEAVDPETLQPVEEGEAELLLTCLERVASPIIRFRTRDRVTVVPAHSVGNPTSSLGLRVGTIGRWDDMLKLRGNNVWPSQLDEAILGISDVADYLATVTLDARGVEQLGIVVRPAPVRRESDDALAALVARQVKAHTNVRPSVALDPELPAPDAKPKRLLDRRNR